MKTAEVLATELETLAPTTNPVVAAQRFAAAYRRYMEDSVANAIPVSASALSPCEAAMIGALPFTTSSTPALLQAALVAFWGPIVASPGLFFSAATVVTPPPLAVAAPLATTFAANIGANLSLGQAAAEVAADLHAGTLGATATFPGPVVAPIL
ncbi:MAG: hypothetical protein ACPGVG_19725 [Mycobacterium sp.]